MPLRLNLDYNVRNRTVYRMLVDAEVQSASVKYRASTVDTALVGTRRFDLEAHVGNRASHAADRHSASPQHESRFQKGETAQSRKLAAEIRIASPALTKVFARYNLT
jgi:hypothetical protein